jgi:hypothetical protein
VDCPEKSSDFFGKDVPISKLLGVHPFVLHEAVLFEDIVVIVALVRITVVVDIFVHVRIIPDQGLEVKEKREESFEDHSTGRKRKDRAEPVEDANQGMEGREQIVLHGHIIPHLVGAGQEVGQEIVGS